MVDMSKTVAPKSDQMNYDDFVGGQSRTIKITRVSGSDSTEQPVSLFYEGDGGKPFKPCKSMRRVLIALWGTDGQTYVGRSLTLYGDPDVKFGGMTVGGIRISHASHISETKTMALTATKGHRKAFTVKPLQVNEQNSLAPAPANVPPLPAGLIEAGDTAASNGVEFYTKWVSALSEDQKASVRAHHNKAWSATAKAADKAFAEEAAKQQPTDGDQLAV